MVNLVLDDLCCPTSEGLEASLELLVLVLYLNGLPALGLTDASEGEAALLRLVRTGFFDDLRVEHHHVTALVVKDNDPLVDADHIGCHAHATVLVGGQSVQQILGDA